MTNSCGTGTDLLSFVCDSTPSKQGRLVSGFAHSVMSPEAFAEAHPDNAVLFTWSHAEEIMAKEKAFRDRGGRWISYVPDLRVA